jgi:hypothetical protein
VKLRNVCGERTQQRGRQLTALRYVVQQISLVEPAHHNHKVQRFRGFVAGATPTKLTLP